ncbi:hypothetical protein EDB92DRAFT_1820333 [Lactarius akahatsu]|uniref:CCHC-type domain-containing protein n=1 Tax=Lactarius akahatsu TaxID=416441 RepID=A0AAD4Q8N8_9AGAM|nr:hypothetical protein EDB92DRAFT_1820333 [Lactarius akahatsu]
MHGRVHRNSLGAHVGHCQLGTRPQIVPRQARLPGKRLFSLRSEPDRVNYYCELTRLACSSLAITVAWRATYRETVRWNKKRNPATVVGGRVTLYSRDCPEPQTGSGGFGSAAGGGSAGAECYRCGKIGHIARACPEAPGGGSGYGNNTGGGSYGNFSSGGGGGQKTWCVKTARPRVEGHLSRDCVQGSKCYNCSGIVGVSILLFGRFRVGLRTSK